MVRAKPTAAKQTNWGEKQVALTWSAGHTLAYETTYVITLVGVKGDRGDTLSGGTVHFTTQGKE